MTPCNIYKDGSTLEYDYNHGFKNATKTFAKKCMYKLHKKIKNKIDAKVRTLDPKIASLPFNGSTELHGKLANLVQINLIPKK